MHASTQRMKAWALAIGLGIAAGGGACAPSDADTVDDAPTMAFDTATVFIATTRDTIRVVAEVARTGEQRTMGLMERRSLADTAGMLFAYETDQAANAGFWMFRTRIPLDIAFADSAGRIVAIRTMAPCEAQLAAGCPGYEPGHRYRSALEVNAGFFARHGITAGNARMWSVARRPPR
jgi:uncharacterized protein